MQNRSNHADVPKSVQGESGLSTLPDLNGKPMSANGLRNGVYRALSKVALYERVPLYKNLIGDLEKAGINVGSRLFLLGIPAKIPEELTPSDIGKLIRSVYINEPQVVKAISATLIQILSGSEGNKRPYKSTSRKRKTRKQANKFSTS
jgi:hypothetical protein